MPIAMKKEELDLYIRVYDKVEENLKELREEIIHKKYMNHNFLYNREDIAIGYKLPRNSGKPFSDWTQGKDNITSEEVKIAFEKGEFDLNTYVATSYCFELSWLFFRLKDIFGEHGVVEAPYNDHEFFGNLSHTANNYINSTRSNSISYLEKLLLSVHEEAYSWMKEARNALPIDED